MQIIFLAIAIAFGVFGYKHVENFERQYGTGPGGGGAALWGIVCFFLGLLGVLVLYLAENSTKRTVQASSVVWSAQQQYGAPAYGAQPYGAQPYGTPAAPPAGQWGPPPAAPPAGQWAPPPPPAQWAPPAEPRPNVGGSEFLPGRN